MKKEILLGMAALALLLTNNACNSDKNRDTQKPKIELRAPKEGAEIAIGNPHGIHFDCKFSDNVEVKNYRVEIHNNFDHHTHTPQLQHKEETKTVPFFFNRSWEVNQRNADIHHHEIVVPENATPGEYHFVVYCLDVNKNESMVHRTIYLKHMDHDDHGHHGHGHSH